MGSARALEREEAEAEAAPWGETPEKYLDLALDKIGTTIDALDASDAQAAAFQVEFAIRALTLARLLCLEGPQNITIR